MCVRKKNKGTFLTVKSTGSVVRVKSWNTVVSVKSRGRIGLGMEKG